MSVVDPGAERAISPKFRYGRTIHGSFVRAEYEVLTEKSDGTPLTTWSCCAFSRIDHEFTVISSVTQMRGTVEREKSICWYCGFRIFLPIKTAHRSIDKCCYFSERQLSIQNDEKTSRQHSGRLGGVAAVVVAFGLVSCNYERKRCRACWEARISPIRRWSSRRRR